LFLYIVVNYERQFIVGIKKEEDALHNEFNEFVLCQIKQLSVRAEHVTKETRRDPHLGRIIKILEADLTRASYKAPEVNY